MEQQSRKQRKKPAKAATQEELDYIVEHWPTGRAADIAERLGRGWYTRRVSATAFRLGLRKDPIVKAAAERERCAAVSPLSHRPKAQAKQAATLSAIYDSERRRVIMGLDQRTKVHIGFASPEKMQFRANAARRRGYKIIRHQTGEIYYDRATRRSERIEQTAREKWRMRVLPWPEDGEEDEE